jgi:hypothetical protein
VRSMKQVIHVIGAAIFDRCADVVLHQNLKNATERCAKNRSVT